MVTFSEWYFTNCSNFSQNEIKAISLKSFVLGQFLLIESNWRSLDAY